MHKNSCKTGNKKGGGYGGGDKKPMPPKPTGKGKPTNTGKR